MLLLHVCARRMARPARRERGEGAHFTPSRWSDNSNARPANENGDPRAAVFVSQSRIAYSSGTISSATMLMILINGLIAGPAVSL